MFERNIETCREKVAQGALQAEILTYLQALLPENKIGILKILRAVYSLDLRAAKQLLDDSDAAS